MDYHEMYLSLKNNLRYIIECRHCGGRGAVPGKWELVPCTVCCTSGVEAVSAADKIVEESVLDSYRFCREEGIEVNEILEGNELEV